MESEFEVHNTEKNQVGNPEFRKKKKKKSFLKQAKKHGERGHFGKGHDIDASTYNYFVQVLDTGQKRYLLQMCSIPIWRKIRNFVVTNWFHKFFYKLMMPFASSFHDLN